MLVVWAIVAAPDELTVWFGHVPVMVTFVPGTREGVAVPVPPFTTGRMPATPVVSGSPVAFVRTPEAGVPRAGAVKVGEVSVNPASVAHVDPREQEVLPMVREEWAKALFGIADAETDRVGVTVEVVTEGTNHVGQSAVLAMKFVTEPPPVPEPVKLQVTGFVPVQPPAPALNVRTYGTASELIVGTPLTGAQAAPRVQAVPLIVIDGLASPALPRVPLTPKATFPKLVLEKLKFRPLKGEALTRLSVVWLLLSVPLV